MKSESINLQGKYNTRSTSEGIEKEYGHVWFKLMWQRDAGSDDTEVCDAEQIWRLYNACNSILLILATVMIYQKTKVKKNTSIQYSIVLFEIELHKQFFHENNHLRRNDSWTIWLDALLCRKYRN
jgi:hypothetical protein